MRGHGEGTIFQRKDGRWQAQITLEGGQRQRKTFYGKTKKEVQEKLRVAINEQKQGTLATGQAQTLKVYLLHWIDDVHKSSVTTRTYLSYRASILTFRLNRWYLLDLAKPARWHCWLSWA